MQWCGLIPGTAGKQCRKRKNTDAAGSETEMLGSFLHGFKRERNRALAAENDVSASPE
jgi:hypothetical protein